MTTIRRKIKVRPYKRDAPLQKCIPLIVATQTLYLSRCTQRGKHLLPSDSLNRCRVIRLCGDMHVTRLGTICADEYWALIVSVKDWNGDLDE